MVPTRMSSASKAPSVTVGFMGAGRKSDMRLSPEIFGVGRNRKRAVAALIADRRVGHEAQRNDAGPDGKSVILGIVFNGAAADFRGDFGERKPKNACGF